MLHRAEVLVATKLSSGDRAHFDRHSGSLFDQSPRLHLKSMVAHKKELGILLLFYNLIDDGGDWRDVSPRTSAGCEYPHSLPPLLVPILLSDELYNVIAEMPARVHLR